MLHKLIQKQMNPNKRKSLGPEPPRASINDFINNLASPKLAPESGLFRRKSTLRTNSQDFTNASFQSMMYVQHLDQKNKKIWVLEEKIKQISELLFELYEKLKESLMIDEVSFFFLLENNVI